MDLFLVYSPLDDVLDHGHAEKQRDPFARNLCIILKDFYLNLAASGSVRPWMEEYYTRDGGVLHKESNC